MFIITGTAFADVPATPTLYSPFNNSTVNGTLVSFTWNPAANAAYYLLQLSTDWQFNSLLVNKYEDTWTSDIYSPLPDNGSTYLWRVFACNSDGCSESATWPFTNGPSAPPDTPYLYFPANNVKIDGPAATFDWTDTARAAQYYLQIALDSNFENILIDDVVTTSTLTLNSSMPDNGLTYYWRVGAHNSYNGGSTTYSSYRTITSGPSAAPETPILIFPMNGDTTNDLLYGSLFVWEETARAADYYL